jgi:FkbM family methyltransferase
MRSRRTPREVASETVQRVLRRRGLEVAPYLPGTGDAARRAKLLRGRDVGVLLDVGANIGQWVTETRAAGYTGRVVSFEPLSEVFPKLSKAAKNDPLWQTRNHALGPTDGSAQINVSKNRFSSSLLPMEERHERSAPQSAYVATEDIEVRRLDSIWSEVVPDGEPAFLKLDVQGFEFEVLKGAGASIPQIVGIQAELSFVPLYEGAPLFREMIDHLDRLGFELAGVEPGFEDPDSGEMLQADGLFVRRAG